MEGFVKFGHICTHAQNSAHTEFLSKEASTEYYSLLDCLYRHRKQMYLLLLNEIKREAISHTSCSMPKTWHFDYSAEEVRSPSLYYSFVHSYEVW